MGKLVFAAIVFVLGGALYVAASLTPVLIQQQYLARWDGRLPQYTLGGSGAVPFLQIPTPGEGRR
jgi:hypothetical protein